MHRQDRLFMKRLGSPSLQRGIIFVMAINLSLFSGAVTGAEEGPWLPLFDGESLEGWSLPEFGGEGEVECVDGEIRLDWGASLTGITLEADFPTTDYEIQFEAKRVDGNDFFCGLTFPVEEAHCTFILGGWGGATAGLSNIDGRDASGNETTFYRRIEQGAWYCIRIRVTEGAIQAWLDGEKIIDLDCTDATLSTRPEVDLSIPLGFAAWETRAALRDIKYREINSP